MKTIFLVLSIVCFLLATILALGAGSVTHAAALIPAGLMFFASAFLPAPGP